jgi:hypothetical protein
MLLSLVAVGSSSPVKPCSVRAAESRVITGGFIARQSAYDVLVRKAMATVLAPRFWTVPVAADPNERNTAVLP